MKDNEFYMEATKFSYGLLTMVKFIFMRTCLKLAKSMGLTLFPSTTSKFFKTIVAETIRAREEKGIVRPDIIHLLMQARDKKSDSVHKMTLDDIISQAFFFFLANFDTTRRWCASPFTNWRLIKAFRIVCARRCNSISPKETARFPTTP